MKTIGIIEGSTHIATQEYYRLITSTIQSHLGGLHTGEIIISSVDLAESARLVHADAWAQGATWLSQRVRGLEAAGADFIICVSNTWHRVADEFMKGSNLPLLHIADPTGEAIVARGIRRVALLGTKSTMSTPFYPRLFEERFGLEVSVPTGEQQHLIDRVIFEELSRAHFSDESRNAYLDIIDDLVARGAQGVILGCTEIPLLVSQTDRPDVPMFDTLRLHAKAAAMMAISD